MEIAALVALGVSGAVSWRQLRISEQANTLPVVVDLVRQHRSVRLARARTFVHEDCLPAICPWGWPACLSRDKCWYASWPGTTTTSELL
ncbi:hypothetical protein ACFWN5_19335 [Streptomyces sp. NPDC058430]|uniref:hypothetical protein n=1 Tax=Streptomyces sp. NPDC058430 TaxID=3346495 RepID=UPI0036670ADD